MTTKFVILVALALQLAFLAACSTLKTGVKPTRTKETKTEMVPQESVRQLALAIEAWDRERFDKLLQENDPADPVVLCAEANFELREGNYENALSLFQDALALVEQRRIPCVSQAVPFQVPEEAKKRSAEAPSVVEDKEILKSARQFFYGEIANAEMIRVLASRSETVPYPPAFRSTMGLTLELINEHAGKTDYLVYRFANYPAVNEDSAKASLAIRKVLAINVVLSALLAGNQEALQTGMAILKNLPKADSETAFFIGLAGFFLRSDDTPKFLNRNVRSLLTN